MKISFVFRITFQINNFSVKFFYNYRIRLIRVNSNVLTDQMYKTRYETNEIC